MRLASTLARLITRPVTVIIMEIFLIPSGDWKLSAKGNIVAVTDSGCGNACGLLIDNLLAKLILIDYSMFLVVSQTVQVYLYSLKFRIRI